MYENKFRSEEPRGQPVCVAVTPALEGQKLVDSNKSI